MSTAVTTALTVGALLGLVGIGLGACRRRIRQTRARIRTSKEFLDLLTRYYTSDGADQASYLDLVRRSGLVQSDMGPFAVATYKPPAASYLVHNYQVIVNQVPELERAFRMRSALSRIDPAHEAATMIRDCILRFLGELEVLETRQGQEMRNPLVLFREGVRAVLALPLWIGQSLGLLTAQSARAIQESGVARIISGGVALLTFVSAVVGTIAGWDAFWVIVRRWLHLP